MPVNHNFWRERRAEADSIRGPSAYQPSALPLVQTDSRLSVNLSTGCLCEWSAEKCCVRWKWMTQNRSRQSSRDTQTSSPSKWSWCTDSWAGDDTDDVDNSSKSRDPVEDEWCRSRDLATESSSRIRACKKPEKEKEKKENVILCSIETTTTTKTTTAPWWLKTNR